MGNENSSPSVEQVNSSTEKQELDEGTKTFVTNLQDIPSDDKKEAEINFSNSPFSSSPLQVPADLKLAIQGLNISQISAKHQYDFLPQKQNEFETDLSESTKNYPRNTSFSGLALLKDKENVPMKDNSELEQEEKKLKIHRTRIKGNPTQSLLINDLKDQLVSALNEIKYRDEAIRKLLTQTEMKDSAIQELTDKVMDIKSQIQVLTSHKNQQIQDLQMELMETEQQLSQLDEVYLHKEEKFAELIVFLQQKMQKAKMKIMKKENEVQFWKDRALNSQEETDTRGDGHNVSSTVDEATSALQEKEAMIKNLQKEVERLQSELREPSRDSSFVQSTNSPSKSRVWFV